MKKSKLAVLLTASIVTLSSAMLLVNPNILPNLKSGAHVEGQPYTLTIDENTKFTANGSIGYTANVKTEDNNIVQINMGNCTLIDDKTPYFVLLNSTAEPDYSDAGYICNPFVSSSHAKYENKITNLKSITVYYDGEGYDASITTSSTGNPDYADNSIDGNGMPFNINTPNQNYFRLFNTYYEDLKVSKIVITYDCI